MFDRETLEASREAAARWRADYDRIASRFEDPSANGGPGGLQTHSGIPLKPCYFPHDVEDLGDGALGAPGAYPYTRGNLAAQYQFMTWANQPVIGYGLPEQTRERMDVLAERGMVGYFLPALLQPRLRPGSTRRARPRRSGGARPDSANAAWPSTACATWSACSPGWTRRR